jgi:replicative DNA helicase
MQCNNNVTAVQIANLNKLISLLDINDYNYDYDLKIRVKAIKLYTDAVANVNIHDPILTQTYIHENDDEVYQFMTSNNLFEDNEFAPSDCRYITEVISERLQYSYVYVLKDDIVTLLEKLDEPDNKYSETVDSLKIKISNLLAQLQSVNSSIGLIKEFDFSSPRFEQLINVIVEKSKKASYVLHTGMKKFNDILSPGFIATRLYVILGGTGKFKSGLMLNLADQIRKFNPQLKPVENGRRKTILFITMENTIEETVERLYDMYSEIESDMRMDSAQNVIGVLKKNGEFEFDDDIGIDIVFRYYGNLEITTAAIPAMIQEIEENNSRKIICVFLDYLLKIDSALPGYKDEKQRLESVTRELKAIAQMLELPIITAMQFNREGNAILDSAMAENKSDVGKFLGSTHVGLAWGIIQEADWVLGINLERKKSTGQICLSYNRLKIRYKKNPDQLKYFSYPFVNEKAIRLSTDMNTNECHAIYSLSNDLETIDDSESDYKNRRRNKHIDTQQETRGNRVAKRLSAIELDHMLSNHDVIDVF